MKTTMWLEQLLEEYYTFLKGRNSIIEKTGTDWHVISTPFVGLFNDTIELYVKKQNDKILLSDDSITINNLNYMGSSISRSPKRKEIMDKILLNYGLSIKDNEIFTEATERSFVQKKFSFISAISEINDMYMLNKNSTYSIFMEDVKKYLDEQEIIYTPSFIAKGTTGLEFNFDFQIAGHHKEIVIKSFNNLNKLNVPSFLFGWEDIKPAREKITNKQVTALAFINNEEKEVKDEYLEAFNTKNSDIILFTERHTPENIAKLKAA
ncbi:MAG: DUF1828 domain-containing protein [Burkholderiales bacterium]|nr:DUF1828 domain-containing protein [Burkholderiales bacterium]